MHNTENLRGRGHWVMKLIWCMSLHFKNLSSWLSVGKNQYMCKPKWKGSAKNRYMDFTLLYLPLGSLKRQANTFCESSNLVNPIRDKIVKLHNQVEVGGAIYRTSVIWFDILVWPNSIINKYNDTHYECLSVIGPAHNIWKIQYLYI